MILFDDTLFLSMLQNGDTRAYSHLFDCYFDKLFMFASNMIFREDIAKDIVQDVFIKMYEKPTSFSNIHKFQGYLFKSVRSRCYNYLRDIKVEDKHFTLYTQALIISGNMDVFSDEDLFATMDVEDVLLKVEAIFEQLPDKCKEVCRMRFMEKKKYSEIANSLGISENTVKVHIFRAMEKIRVDLKDYNFTILLFMISLFK